MPQDRPSHTGRLAARGPECWLRRLLLAIALAYTLALPLLAHAYGRPLPLAGAQQALCFAFLGAWFAMARLGRRHPRPEPRA